MWRITLAFRKHHLRRVQVVSDRPPLETYKWVRGSAKVYSNQGPALSQARMSGIFSFTADSRRTAAGTTSA